MPLDVGYATAALKHRLRPAACPCSCAACHCLLCRRWFYKCSANFDHKNTWFWADEYHPRADANAGACVVSRATTAPCAHARFGALEPGRWRHCQATAIITADCSQRPSRAPSRRAPPVRQPPRSNESMNAALHWLMDGYQPASAWPLWLVAQVHVYQAGCMPPLLHVSWRLATAASPLAPHVAPPHHHHVCRPCRRGPCPWVPTIPAAAAATAVGQPRGPACTAVRRAGRRHAVAGHPRDGGVRPRPRRVRRQRAVRGLCAAGWRVSAAADAGAGPGPGDRQDRDGAGVRDQHLPHACMHACVRLWVASMVVFDCEAHAWARGRDRPSAMCIGFFCVVRTFPAPACPPGRAGWMLPYTLPTYNAHLPAYVHACAAGSQTDRRCRHDGAVDQAI